MGTKSGHNFIALQRYIPLRTSDDTWKVDERLSNMNFLALGPAASIPLSSSVSSSENPQFQIRYFLFELVQFRQFVSLIYFSFVNIVTKNIFLFNWIIHHTVNYTVYVQTIGRKCAKISCVHTGGFRMNFN